MVGQPFDSTAEPPLSPAAAHIGGLKGKIGQALATVGPDGQLNCWYGIDDIKTTDADAVRDAAAAFALAATQSNQMAFVFPDGMRLAPELAARAAVEGMLLARYTYDILKEKSDATSVRSLTLIVAPEATQAAQRGARQGMAYARATALARDLANSPPSLLTAQAMADCATQLGAQTGFEVHIFDTEALRALGCGGLLGVNAGSVEPPRMIKLRYTPPGEPRARLALVGKGVMYDSGGISLKPSDAIHATMKNDMSGAGAILAAMAMLREMECPNAITAYLMCTDNMPSGSATKLGDVLTIRGGKTVEVVNTDAEGRLVMADALVLATEEPTDAIVDIATLTGACLRALGAEIAGVFGNDQELVDNVLAAALVTGEPAWQLPLAHRYRGELESEVADIKNLGGPNAAAIHGALFLEEFVDGIPWAHLDIAGAAQNDSAKLWRRRGCTGFGARTLLELALNFRGKN
ncbi:MAG: leucyl aminopeptidase [Corynebacteriales bacterium]|nr:leucyl aminopeptidase [Mycobacteriales bacterium]